MAARKLDAMLITSITNVFYLSGFTGSTAAVAVTEDDSYILVDPRYSIQARAECPETIVRDYTGKSTIAAAADLINELAPGTAGYEAQHVTVAGFRELKKLTRSGISLRATGGMVEQLRRTKDASEIALIEDAVRIADAAFDVVVRELRHGMTERQVALLIDSTLRTLGADRESFPTIAASGLNSACPHASPTDAILKPHSFLTMDFGAAYKHYCSDITRTVCIGTPTAKQREVYQVVLDAQLAAIDAIRPGLPGKDVDAVARDYIASRGYGDCFGHGLGHALGIEVHDGPAFSKSSDAVLEPGMVVTVEPGIYIEGWGGVRTEDDVVVTEDGARILTGATKELLSI